MSMLRRVACLSLLFAWFCASESLLDVAQGFAWVRMFAGYARTESVSAAARDTFDPARPCELCKVVSKARQAFPAATVPSATAGKLVLFCQDSGELILNRSAQVWLPVCISTGARRVEDVPLPPPRGLIG